MEHLRWENSLGFRVWEGCDELSRDHTDAQQKDFARYVLPLKEHSELQSPRIYASL